MYGWVVASVTAPNSNVRFPCRPLGFSECEGCVPREIEKWTGIIPAIADLSGYSVALRLELVETVQRKKRKSLSQLANKTC